MAQGQQGGGGQDPNSGVFIVVGTFILLALAYYLLHQKIIAIMFYIKGLELQVISHFLPNYKSLTLWMESVPLNQVTYNDLRALAADVGQPLQWPLIIITLVLAVIAYKFHPTIGYKSIENMGTLSDKMLDEFPCLKVTHGLDLVNTPINEGPWSMALTPVEFAKQNRLIARDAVTGQIEVNGPRAKTLFVAQLGRPWKEIDDLQPHERAIFAVLATYINYKRDLAELTLEGICQGLTQDKLKRGKLDFNKAEVLLSKYGNSPAVEAITHKHAYVLTVLSAMLEQARSTGIVANAQYLWLKPIDRRLWYTLNSVGRRVAFVESAAIRAHLLAEKEMQMAVSMPMVDEAVSALEEAIHSRIVTEI